MTPPPNPRGPRRLLPRLLLVVLSAWMCVLWFGACDPKPPTPVAARSWPAGTVMTLNGAPIRVDDVDAAGSMIAAVEPSYSLEHLRRLALTNVVIPRLAGIELAGARREQARALAERCQALVQSGADTAAPLVGVLVQTREGGFRDVGMECFDYALNAPFGKWSPVTESIGMFEIYRAEERSKADAPREMHVKVTVWVVPYLEPEQAHAQIDAQLDRSRIVFVDDAWRDVLPEYWKHRLRGDAP